MKALTLLLFVVVGATSAFADQFTFSLTGPGNLQGQGLLTAVLTPHNNYLLTSVNGEINGAPITGLIAPNHAGISYYNPDPYHYFTYDNLIFDPSTPIIDDPGFLFTVRGLSSPVNLFNRGTGTNGQEFESVFNFSTRSFTSTAVQLSITKVAAPEPKTGTLTLVSLMLLLVAAWGLKERRVA